MFKIFVGNLSSNTTADAVRLLFERHADVADIALPIDPETNKPRGFAIVMIKDELKGKAAIMALRGARLNGRTLVINPARKKGDPPPPKRPARGRGPGGGGGRGGFGGGRPAGGGGRGGYSSGGGRPDSGRGGSTGSGGGREVSRRPRSFRTRPGGRFGDSGRGPSDSGGPPPGGPSSGSPG